MADPEGAEGRVFAIVPAAGRSRRMGRAKLLLPLGGRPVIGHLLDALRAGGVERTVVVVRGDDSELRRVVAELGATAVVPADEPADMRESVQHAVRRIGESCAPSGADALLVAPGDVPLVGAEVVAGLIAERRRSGARIVVPVFEGRRGHPVVLAWTLAEEILALEEGVGLNALARRHEGETVEVRAESASVLEDLDSPDDYERVRRGLDSSRGS